MKHNLELALQEMEAWPLGAETADLGRGAKPPNEKLCRPADSVDAAQPEGNK